MIEPLPGGALPAQAGEPGPECRTLAHFESAGLRWEAGWASATVSPPAGTRLGPTAGGRPVAATSRRALRVTALHLAAGAHGVSLLSIDAAPLAASSAARIAARCGGPALVAPSGCVTGAAWCDGGFDPPLLEALEATAAATAMLAARRRGPAILRPASGGIDAEADAPPGALGYLDLLTVDREDGRSLWLACVPPPDYEARGEGNAGDEPLLAARERLERASSATVLLVPSCEPRRAETRAGSAERALAAEVRLAAAVLAAWAQRGLPLVPRLGFRAVSVALRTAPLPDRAAVTRALEQAEAEAEYGRGDRELAGERAVWLRRLEQAACDQRAATVLVPVNRLRLGSWEIIGVGAGLEAEAAACLLEPCGDAVVGISSAGGRAGLVTPRPGRPTVADPQTEPLCDIWPLAPQAAVLLGEAAAKD